MKNFTRFLTIYLFLASTIVYSQDLLISGGNTVSTIICANGNVYTWGNNVAGPSGSQVTGILGNGSALPQLNSPGQVNFPTNDPYFVSLGLPNITVRAVDAGSGAHFIAVDCQGGAWSWGNNSYNGGVGITGTGSAANGVTIPTRVLRGEAPNIGGLLANYLVNVRYISGGNDNSYVILNDGRALAWGKNDKGQLGNGTLVNSTTPVFVDVPGGTPLANVIQIEAGDETAYALVDPDGDGIGTVYSWGAGTGQFGGAGMLGRNAAGTANTGIPAETANDPFARPVLNANGTQLNNIVSISAGDVMCLALDIEGNVWAWGNGGWGTMTGQGANIGNHSDPRRVVAGEWGTTAGAGMGQGYLKAKAISAGQGYGMAVTTDGKPVAWGNNGACGTAASGGSLGDGTTTTTAAPKFIRRGGAVDNNVVSISDGDTWGFYTTSANLIYTWGNNASGQLGIGSTACQNSAVQFTLPPCTFPHPKPLATITPRSFSVCTANWSGTVLNSGFTIAAALQASYSIVWRRNGSIVSTGNGSNVTYNATTPGTYEVTIQYVGTNAPCSPYTPAVDQIVIATYPQDFTVAPITCTGNPLAFRVATGNGLYDWYTAATGGTLVGTSYRTGDALIPASSVTQVSGTTYTLYVEQKGYVAGNTGAVSPATCGGANMSNMQPPTNSNTMIRVYGTSVTVDTITVYQNSEYQGSTLSHNWQVCAYGTQFTNGNPIADRSNVIACGPLVARPGVDQPGVGMLKIPVGITLPGSALGTDYWLGFSNSTNGIGIKFNCNPGWPVLDDVPGGEYLNIRTIDNYGNPANQPEWGLFANIKFHSEQRFCTRVPVTVTCTLLPVVMNSFEGTRNGIENSLGWSTASEDNAKGFTLQRSVDGVNFENVTWVNAMGAGYSYSFKDKTLLSKCYYRLLMTDWDGYSELSNVICISESSEGNIKVLSNDQGTIELNASNCDLQNALFIIVSLEGKEILKDNIHSLEKNVYKKYSDLNITSGVYLYHLVTTTGKHSGKLLVKN